MVQTFETLHSRHGVLGCDPRFVKRSAVLAAESWRVMTKHLYNTALAEKTLSSSSLQALVKMVRLHPERSPAGSNDSLEAGYDSADQPAHEPAHEPAQESRGARSAADMSASAVEELFNMRDVGDTIDSDNNTELDSDVELCGVHCKCIDCTRARAIILDDDGDDQMLVEIPSAAIGGQKRDTKRMAQAEGVARKGKGKGGAKKDKGGAKEGKTGGTKVKGGGKEGKSDGPKAKGGGKKGKGGAKHGKIGVKVKLRLRGKQGAQGTSYNNTSDAIATPTAITVRRESPTRRAEAYLLDSAGSYVVGLNSGRSPEFVFLVETLRDRINSGAVRGKQEAKAWLNEQAS